MKEKPNLSLQTWRDVNTSPRCQRGESAHGWSLSLNETLRLSSPFILPSLHPSISPSSSSQLPGDEENLEENWR